MVVVGAGNDGLRGLGLCLGHAQVANGTFDGLKGGSGGVYGVAALGLGLSLGGVGMIVVALLRLRLSSMRLLGRWGNAVGGGIGLGWLLLMLGWRGLGLLGVVGDLGDVRGRDGVLGWQGWVGQLG